MNTHAWIPWIALSGAASVAAQRALTPPAAAPQQPFAAPSRAERPDDAPVAGSPVPIGAPRSAPLQVGPYTAYQVNVSASGANIPGDAANETSIAVDPTNRDRMVIGWRQFDSIASNFRQAGWAYTLDAGRTWTFPGVIEPGVFRSDPVLAADAQGNFYYNSLTLTGGGQYLCSVFKSSNHGLSWGPNVAAFGGDKQWMVIDTTASQGAGHLYQAWSAFAGCCGGNTFNRSTNAGASFSTPIAIPQPPIWGTLDVASDGTLYIGGTSTQSFSTFLIARSSNARNAAVTPTFDLNATVNLGGSVGFSLGASSPNPGGLLGQVNLAVDRSNGPTAGNVYMLAAVDPAGADPADVHFIRSTNGGLTWSAPLRVNDDPPTSGAWQWFGTMSVAPNGRIDAVWNDTRNTGQPNLSETRYSFSTDGGLTWSPSQVLTPVWNSHLGWPNQNKIGDYYQMVSDNLGADLAFAATFNGEEDVYYMRLGDRDCNHNGVGDSLDISSGTSTDVNQNGIPDDCECGALSYCTGAANSSGSGATLTWSGSLSLSANTFQLAVSGCPPAKSGVFFYAPTQVQTPFGDGFRCAGGATLRLGPMLQTSAGGAASRLVNFNAPPASTGAGQITPLSTWNFQFWYRDGAAAGSGFNLSDGLSVTFCP